MATRSQLGEILSLREVAELLRCNRSTIYRMLKRREIPGFKVGGDWRFDRAEIEAWIAKRTQESIGVKGKEKEKKVPSRNSQAY